MMNASATNGAVARAAPPVAIRVRGLKRHFKGGQIKAVDGIDLDIQKGTIFALLGPNGAGKTTAIRVLTTVLRPDAGEVIIQGLPLQSRRAAIRHLIGVCPQEVVFYEDLTAEENVTFVARMHDLPKARARARATALLTQLGIAGRDDKVKNFSGGMKRRLNVAMALVHDPQIAFLDEPSAGLDPQARRVVWDFIRDLKRHGMTVILTTHDMVEADAISDYVAIIDKGKIIARGTPEELKRQFGKGNVLELSFLEADHRAAVKGALEGLEFISRVTAFGDNKLLITFGGGVKNFVAILKRGFVNQVNDVENMSFRQNSLEDVFLHLTGRRLRDQ